jgi:hypothetical protein
MEWDEVQGCKGVEEDGCRGAGEGVGAGRGVTGEDTELWFGERWGVVLGWSVGGVAVFASGDGGYGSAVVGAAEIELDWVGGTLITGNWTGKIKGASFCAHTLEGRRETVWSFAGKESSLNTTCLDKYTLLVTGSKHL